MDSMVSATPIPTPRRNDAAIRENRQINMSQFDADGRRQLLGLSQAIRRHAHQSTSPTSEIHYGNRQRARPQRRESAKHRAKSAPTVEDRLRSLLNGDTDDAETQCNGTKVTFDKPPTFELASKGCHGSYSPRLAESKMRAERLNRPACGDPKPAVDISPQRLYQRTRSLSSENILKDAPLRVSVSSGTYSPPSSVCGTQTNTVKSQLRRCVSAAPSSFGDENWNVVPESPTAIRERLEQSATCPGTPPLTPSALGRRTPTGAYNLAIWDQRPPPSPSRVMTLPHSSPSLKQPASTPVWATTRGHFESNSRPNECSSSCRTLEYSPTTLPTSGRDKNAPSKFVFRTGSPANLPANPVNGHLLRVASPMSQSPLSRQGCPVERRPRPIQYVEPPSPAGIRMISTVPRSCKYPQEEVKVSKSPAANPGPSTTKSAPPVPVKRTGDKIITDKQQRDKVVNPPQNQNSPNDDDPDSCKSEDRDSGAILDAEASVFDFDSSVMSDSELETSQQPSQSQSPSKNKNADMRERVWSRSSTPILPPLSPYESEAETPRINSPVVGRCASNRDAAAARASPVALNPVACLPSYDSLVRKKAAGLARMERHAIETTKYTKYDSHDIPELSPTESAIAESCDQVKEPNGTRNFRQIPSSHVTKRRNSRTSSRASSCDERRAAVGYGRHRVGKRAGRQKGAHKRRQKGAEEYTFYDIEDATQSSKTLGRYPVFYRPEEDGDKVGDMADTSSVRSFTSASAASSGMRKHGRRHRRRQRQIAAIDKAYAKEVRAVNKRFTRLEAHVVMLARTVAQLSSDVQQEINVSHELENLRTEIEEVRRQKSSSARKSSTSSTAKAENSKKAAILKSQPKRVSKLTKFFGEKPPILSLFLARMGYEKYVKNFTAESIGMVELAYMDEERLKSIGIPLGPRLRILSEAKKTCFV